jgi:hypothetical protein
MTSRVDVESSVTQKPNQCHLELLRQLYRQAAGCPYGQQGGDACHESFLDQLEARSTADQQHKVGRRQLTCQQASSDQLVHGIVTTDVLGQLEQLSVCIDEGGGMQSPGPREHWLRLDEGGW